MEPEDQALLDVARKVADGEPVDWQRESSGRPDLRAALEPLRLLESIAAAHRRPAAAAEPGAGAGHEPAARPPPDSGGGAASPSAAARTWGPLRILETLGSGGFGEVYRAYDPTLRSDVALKLVRLRGEADDRAVEGFLEEARRLARVRHPNVLAVHGAGCHDGRVGIWTELVGGRTLEELLAVQGPLGAGEAARVGMDVCRALAAVHAAGLVHRDVKTTNVMREAGGRILLMDFGAVAEVAPGGALLDDPEVHGTPLTMAPEQLYGQVAGPATDVYGLGVLLYRLVTGRFPIEAASHAELLEKHRARARVPLRDRRADLPWEFVQVVERCLEPEAEGRYPSAGALERALGASIGAPPAGAPSPSGSRKRRPAVVAGGAAVALLAAALLWHFFWPRPTPTPPAETPPRAVLTAKAALEKVVDGARTSLAHGASVAPGDRLELRFEAPETTYVYVVNEDERGEAFILFPIAGAGPRNPLPPGTAHRLPGAVAGRPVTWEVTSAGGTESILLIASREPLGGLEAELASVPRAAAGAAVRYPRLGSSAAASLRGIGGVTELAPGAETPGRLADAVGRAARSADGDRDVWVWQIQLRNAGR